MAVPTTSEVPLLENHCETEEAETQPLKHSLKRLEAFLRFLGFFHDSSLSFSLSSLSFLLIGIAAPSLIILLFYCGPHRSSSRCDFYHVKTFELEVLICEVAVAAVSLFCISRNLRKYGLRKFLFVDKFHGNSAQFQDQYVSRINISSIVQVVGIIICLHAAAKMSHRAQGLASFASRWHAFATCNSNETLGNASSDGNLDTSNLVIPVVNYSESDLESADYVLPPTNVELAAYMSSYHKRQAFVMYLQSNPGGVTIFGWTVDRALMNTIFFIELSVVTFVLGKTISFSTGNT